MSDGSIRSRKRAIDDARRAVLKAERRAKNPYRRCFWTWPLGHRWSDGHRIIPGINGSEYECLVCGMLQQRYDNG